MKWSQVNTPNYNVPYYGGLCEGFVEGTVGQASAPFVNKNGDYTTTGVYPTASAAWKANKGNHPGELPPAGLRVAVYFNLGSTKDGHVAETLGDGRVASSTQPGLHPSGFIHSSIQDLINTYAKYNNGCTYLGWSEFMGKLRVVKEIQEDIMDTNDGIEAYRVALHREPESDAAAAHWNGKKFSDIANSDIRASAEWQEQDRRLKTYDALVQQVSDLTKQLASTGGATKPSQLNVQINGDTYVPASK